MKRGVPVLVALVVGALACADAACSGWLARSEGIDPAALPESIRPDYDLFALRCSKCHSLARPLSSGIDDDDYWAIYVARMRRQPGSGISVEDTKPILRFLHYYSVEQKRKKEKSAQSTEPTPAPSAAAAPSTTVIVAVPVPVPAPAPTAVPVPVPVPVPGPVPVPAPAPPPVRPAAPTPGAPHESSSGGANGT